MFYLDVSIHFHVLRRETTLVTSCLFPSMNKPFKMGSTLLSEEFAPKEANSSLKELTFAEKGSITGNDRVASESLLIHLNLDFIFSIYIFKLIHVH